MKKKSFVFLILSIFLVLLICSFFVRMLDDSTSNTEVMTANNETETEFDSITEIPVSDVEAFVLEQKNGITKQDAEKLCSSVLGDKAEETGFPISYKCISAIKSGDKMYYVMQINWFVNNQHWSYIGNCYVSSDGQEIYDGVASSSKHEITGLRWKK